MVWDRIRVLFASTGFQFIKTIRNNFAARHIFSCDGSFKVDSRTEPGFSEVGSNILFWQNFKNQQTVGTLESICLRVGDGCTSSDGWISLWIQFLYIHPSIHSVYFGILSVLSIFNGRCFPPEMRQSIFFSACRFYRTGVPLNDVIISPILLIYLVSFL